MHYQENIRHNLLSEVRTIADTDYTINLASLSGLSSCIVFYYLLTICFGRSGSHVNQAIATHHPSFSRVKSSGISQSIKNII